MTFTYGEVAARMGDAGLARAVGQALARNPFAIVVPCHRVLAAGGRPGGFSANGGGTTKLKLLAIEGARTQTAPDLFSPGCCVRPAQPYSRTRQLQPDAYWAVGAVRPS